MKRSVWHGCYDQGWPRDVITPESFSHPAKMAYGLISRIIEHGFEMGYWKKDDLLLDPFGGIGSTGVMCSYKDLRSVSVELEAEFWRLTSGYDCPGISKREWVRWYNRFRRSPVICPECHAKAQGWYEQHSGIIPCRASHHYRGNFELHRAKWEKLGEPQPIMLQGDSRRLVELVGQVDGVVTSPPFMGSLNDTPSHQILAGSGNRMGKSCKGKNYGDTPGQIGRMKPGSVDSVITSPPYAESIGKDNAIDYSKAKGSSDGLKPSIARDAIGGPYGHTPGNLGNLKPGSVDACVTSPPWENIEGANAAHKHKDVVGLAAQRAEGYASGQLRGHYASPAAIRRSLEKANRQIYGDSDGQIGNTSGPTYWQAVAEIYGQCHCLLKPGGVMVVVCKDYVKDKKRVPLCEDTLKLLEHIGFEPIERIRAMQVKEWQEADLFKGNVTKRKEKKGFFRRLAESKGSPRIDWEEVLIVRQKGLWDD